jgi:hypothetical protein
MILKILCLALLPLYVYGGTNPYDDTIHVTSHKRCCNCDKKIDHHQARYQGPDGQVVCMHCFMYLVDDEFCQELVYVDGPCCHLGFHK